MFFISSNTSNNFILSFSSSEKKYRQHKPSWNQTDWAVVTDIQIFQMTRWKGKEILHQWYSMDKLLYSKNTMEFHLNYEWLLEDKHLLAKEN